MKIDEWKSQRFETNKETEWRWLVERENFWWAKLISFYLHCGIKHKGSANKTHRSIIRKKR